MCRAPDVISNIFEGALVKTKDAFDFEIQECVDIDRSAEISDVLESLLIQMSVFLEEQAVPKPCSIACVMIHM